MVGMFIVTHKASKRVAKDSGSGLGPDSSFLCGWHKVSRVWTGPRPELLSFFYGYLGPGISEKTGGAWW